MADLMTADIVLRVFRNVSAVPSDISSAAVQEIISQQLSIDSFTNDAFVLAANAVDEPLPSFPHIPYDAVFFMAVDVDIKVNVNGQGNQIVTPGGFVSFASTLGVLLTNDIVPVGGSVPINANVRYFAGRRVGTPQAPPVGAPLQAFSHIVVADATQFTVTLPVAQPDATYAVTYGVKVLPALAPFPILTFPTLTTTTFDVDAASTVKAGTELLFIVRDIP